MEGATEAACPICLATPGDAAATGAAFVTTPCGHAFCRTCLERVLLRPRERGIPTRAPCPLCRAPVNLFELARPAGQAPIYAVERDLSSWSIANYQYRQRPLTPMANAKEILQEAIDRRGGCDGFGLTFCFRGPAASIKFARPLEVAPDGAGAAVAESAEGTLPTVALVTFDRAYFHRPSMVFYGKVAFARPLRGSDGYFYDILDCLLQFSGNGQYLRRGQLLWRYASTHRQLPLDMCPTFLLDGVWDVHYATGESRRIRVQRHAFACAGETYRIALDSERRPWFAWPGRPVTQRSARSIAPGTPGPGVGDTWEWTTNARQFERIVWSRLATLDDCWRAVPISPGSFVYRRCTPHPNDDHDLSPSHQADKLWGNTFCQFYTVGMASYHFLEPDADGSYRAYISYESPRTEEWPPLDNGAPVPGRAVFRNISWDPGTRTFRGAILWEQDCGTTWMTDARWQYELVFDPSFAFVASGTCRRAEGEVLRFGTDLIYVNAALETSLRSAREGRSSGGYLDVLRQWRDDRASVGTLAMLGEVAMAVMDRRDSMFDFNL